MSRWCARAALLVSAAHAMGCASPPFEPAASGSAPCAVERSSYLDWPTIRLTNGEIELHIAPDLGGRVIAFIHRGHSFLWANRDLAGAIITGEENGGSRGPWRNYGGDKLWPAPQGWGGPGEWPGPGDPILDGGVFEAQILEKGPETAAVRLQSPPDPARTGIRFERTIRIRRGDPRVVFENRMTNISDRPVAWSIWSVTQLDVSDPADPKGINRKLAVYAPVNPRSHHYLGYRVMFGQANDPQWTVAPSGRLFRGRYEYSVGKAGVDSAAGWLGFEDGRAERSLIQRFRFDPKGRYPHGNSVEFWFQGEGEFIAWGKRANPAAAGEKILPYIEIEILSPVVRLAPGASYRFDTSWEAREGLLPADLVPPGDRPL